MKMKHMNISKIKTLNFPKKLSSDGGLFVFEEGAVPFKIKRVFTVHADKDCERGFHAHKLCQQLLVCLKGTCTVICDDGKERREFILSSPHQGLHIPPTIWAEQTYSAGSILMVLTDQAYEESDYIRDYEGFQKFKKDHP